MMNAPRSYSKKLSHHMRELFLNPCFSDVTLFLPGGQSIKAHKAILSTRYDKVDEEGEGEREGGGEREMGGKGRQGKREREKE